MKDIYARRRREVNTDPQRRCYNGCHFSSELVWSEWELIDFDVPDDKVDDRIQGWRESNDYAVSQRGESARREFEAR